MSFLEKIPHWLRWVLSLPCAVIALFIVYPTVYYLNYITTTLFIGDLPGILEKFMFLVLANGASTASFIYVGAKIVPKYNFIIAIFYAILLGIVFGISLISKNMLGNTSSVSWLELLIAVVVGIIVSVVMILQFHEEELKQENY